ncbi:alpha/beta hydrolase [Gorillibacterium sp. sgz5001074]|uniref:alpha/beta hydrolase n=1 Tax=Gorillibacterium sp. sgz5001074 TaxID=3446695 RepID=UPI003F674422
MWIGIGIGMAALLAVVAAGLWYFSNRVLLIGTWDPDRIIAFESQTGVWNPGYYEGLPKEEVRLDSPFGYPLHGWFIPAPAPTNRTVILVHGVTRSRLTSVKYVELFRKRGFHVFLYDHRRHGASGGRHTTYGYYEKYDLKACVDWVLARTGPDAVIGIHGESMGAATALQHAGVDHRAAFYIADCGYSAIADQLEYRLKVEFPAVAALPIIPLVGWICRLRARFKLGDVSSIDAMRTTDTPVLFIHGDQDDYVPTDMSKAMYEVKPGFKRLYLAPGANHAEAYLKNPGEYDRIVGAFLREIGLGGAEAEAAGAAQG